MKRISILFALLTLPQAIGCNTSSPTPPVDSAVDASADASTDSGQDAGVDAGDDASIDAGTDATVDAGDPCVGPSQCWQCAPTTNAQFLNGCTNATCAPFDNAARIPGFVP